MAEYMSMNTLRFIIHEMLQVEKLCALPRYQDYDKESFDILLDSTKAYADKALFPVFKEMDEQPARFENGKVIVHPSVGQIMKDSGERGAIGSTFDYEVGGLQLPHVLHSAVTHIAQSANNSLPGYTGLTGGAANLIISFGEQSLIEKFVPKMMKGEWAGTMCLTEPQAGSSLSDITTAASPNDDGSYQIKGQKIFISGGDHEYSENFVHLVLARVDGAPLGTKGISLFVVPKFRIKEDETLEPNDVITAGDFQKMGQKGYCTTHLVFGENDNCQGWLVGTKNKGLKHMFQMMNGARIDVGLTAVSTATAAYHASLQYAKERPQGRRVESGGVKNASEEQTPIINHPDVRRMLLLQKSITEGAIALLLQASLYQDMSEAGPEEDRVRYHDLLELLTPIAKTYPSEMGRVSISNGVQVLGGYGFCTDFPLEQYYRDIRIMALYEGTTGIQSLDLLGRKVIMKNGEAMKHLTKEIIETITNAANYDDLKPYAEELKNASKQLQEVIMHLVQYAMKGEHERFIADATVFMDFMSTITIAWQWLKMATVAKTALITGNTTFETSFYENKIHTMRFFFKYELPKIHGLKVTLMRPESLTILEQDQSILA
ncbi:MAG: acyl-CoA dehydrogenase [Saprospiraceae bacterium]|nr:MAG: acyl-CoA dehydrogenase [Saprospiraceae bacterium]